MTEQTPFQMDHAISIRVEWTGGGERGARFGRCFAHTSVAWGEGPRTGGRVRHIEAVFDGPTKKTTDSEAHPATRLGQRNCKPQLRQLRIEEGKAPPGLRDFMRVAKTHIN